MPSNIYTIPADVDFLDALAKRLLSETESDPLSLKNYAVLLPDRLACDILTQKLQDLNGGKPMIMPQTVTLDAIDDDVLSLRLAGSDVAEKILALPPAVTKLDRELYLTREILKHPETADSVSTAVRLARELAGFIDELHAAAVPLKKLADMEAKDFPGDLAKTKNLLKVVTDIWPAIKKDMGVMDREERQQAVLGVLSEYFDQKRTNTPLIFAGFSRFSHGMTGLVKSLAKKDEENIRIILPGLDMGVETSWKDIGPSHPQYAFKKLLTDIGASKDKVNYWPGTTVSTHPQWAIERAKLMREAMRPSSTTHKWKHLKVTDKAKLRPSTKVIPKGSPLARKKASDAREINPIALTGLDMIVASTQQEEASTIALKFREMLEKSGVTGTLITPDRALADRVAARLMYWNIPVSSEQGDSLIHTRLGRWMVQTAEMAVHDLAPVPLLETLKSPYTALGKSPAENRDSIAVLEDTVLRGARPWPGFSGLKRSLSSSFNEAASRAGSPARKNALKQTQTELSEWLDNFEKTIKKDAAVLQSEQPVPFKDMLTAHIRLMEAMAKNDKISGADMLWTGADGMEAQRFLKRLLESADILPPMNGEDYLQLSKMLIRESRIKTDTHPRIRILQPGQANLFRSDMNIVAGLTAANWPGKKAEKFWLSSELREGLGLPPLESEVGHAAYHFTQGALNKNTILTRAERNQNAPAVPSPFLTRMEMLLKGLGLEDKLKPKSRILDINTALHRPANVRSMPLPQPKPPAKARPRKLSVSAIEMLLRDPYAVYARYVLKLFPKAPIDAEPSFAERGNIIHDALDRFKQAYPDSMPENAYDKLIELGEEAFADHIDNPSVRAFWWPRFERMAAWFVEYEQAREGLARTLKTEVPGKLEIETEQGKFILTAIADRIDELMDDALSIIDYKTGGVPSKKDVQNGISPQLTLEALIAVSGGFEGIDAKNVGMLEYWKLSGGRPAGKVTQIEGVEELQAAALEGLTRLMQHFSDPDNPYLPTPRPKVAPRYIPYNHLARSDEWGRDISKGKGGGRSRPESKRNATGRKTGPQSKPGGPKS
jgi:ATP-dependent helicase/nuclease subunit B